MEPAGPPPITATRDPSSSGMRSPLWRGRALAWHLQGRPAKALEWARKGWEQLLVLWAQTFVNTRSCELYLKTTEVGCEIMRERNMILDGRFLPRNDLIKLYYDADCFVFPHRGEGWGLTLMEAMASGLPCITTKHSGVLDFTKAGAATDKAPVLQAAE